MTPLVGLTETASDSSKELMADIDVFKRIFKNVAKQVMFN